jgi:hypothetical protein
VIYKSWMSLGPIDISNGLDGLSSWLSSVVKGWLTNTTR